MHIRSKCLDGVGFIVACDGNGRYLPFTLIGSSVPTSAVAGDRVQQLSVSPKKGQGGVVAISCFVGQTSVWECLAVRVFWKDDKLEVAGSAGDTTGRDSFFNPARIGQLYPKTEDFRTGDSWIEVQIRNRRYTSNPQRVGPTTHLVADNDLLCRYWAGDADPIEVIHAAVQIKAEAGKEELFHKQLASAQGESKQLRETLSNKINELSDLHRMYNSCRRTAVALADRLKRRWFLSEEDRQALAGMMSGEMEIEPEM